MSALSSLISAQKALIDAIDARDLDGIEAARVAFESAVAQVRANGAWRDTDELRAALGDALKANDAARIRVRYHRDHVRTRLDRLTALRGEGGLAGYDRAGAVRYRTA